MRFAIFTLPFLFLAAVLWSSLPTPDVPTPVEPEAYAPGEYEEESAGYASPLPGGQKLTPEPAPAVAESRVRVRRAAARQAKLDVPDRGLRDVPEAGRVELPTVPEGTQSETSTAAPSAGGTTPLAPSPGVIDGFAGLDDVPDVGSGFRSIPPDTDGAVGPTKVMETLNNNYRIRDKATGAELATLSPDAFWAGLGAVGLFDPRVLYDPYNDRWIAVSVSDARNTTSSIEIGVSKTGDPEGAWWTFRVDADPATGNAAWADFPTVGFNKNWIAVNVNMFGNRNNQYQGAKVLVVDYPSLRNGSLISSFFSDTDFTMAPAITYSTTEETLYMPAHYGAYGNGNGAYRVWAITGSPGNPALTSPACCLDRGVPWDYTYPEAPQAAPLSGSSSCGGSPCRISTNDDRIGSAPIVRDGFIYYAQTVGLPYPTSTHTGILWTKLDAGTGSVVDGGFIHDSTANSANGAPWFAFPAVAVNADADLMVAYSRFASDEYASSAYSIHLSTDGAGVMRDPVTAKVGEDYYHKTFGGGENRWGDYSDAQVDPTSDTEFWSLQEYARLRVGTDDGTSGTNSSRWGTWWAKVNPHLPAISWDPSNASTRVAERPRTCNSPGPSCTDSGRSWLTGSESVAASNDGSQHYVHAVWTTDAPTGDESNGGVPHGANCSSATNPVTGSAPYCSGVFYSRSGDAGLTWNGGAAGSAPFMVSPGNTHAGRAAIATSGQYVHVAYVTTVGFADQMCAKDARVLWVRTNSNYGAPGAWSAPVRLSSLTGRVDVPSITASGSTVSVVHTNSVSGDIVLDRSTNDGASFSGSTIGHTFATFDNGVSPGSPTCQSPPSPSGLEGYSGRPAISGDGSTTGAAWISNDSGKAVAKISLNGGQTWPGGGGGMACPGIGPGQCTLHLTASGALGAGERSSVSVDAAAGRVGFAWVNDVGGTVPKGVYVRMFDGATGWGPPRLVSCLQNSGPCAGAPAALLYDSGYAPALATYGTSGLGLAWSVCPYTPTDPAIPCDGSASDPGAEILWKESWNNAVTWSAGEGPSTGYRRIVSNALAASEVNERASVVFDRTTGASAGCAQQSWSLPSGIPVLGCNRYVLFTGRTASASTSRLDLSIGTQIPAPT